MKMMDMGYKDKNTIAQPCEASKPENRIRYPSFYLSDKVPDDLFNKDVGDMCEITMLVKITKKGIDENPKEKRKNMDFEIHKLGIENDEKDLEEEIKSQIG